MWCPRNSAPHEDLFHNRPTSRALRFPRDVVDVALVKLDVLNGAASMLVFRWESDDAHKVRLVGYHR